MTMEYYKCTCSFYIKNDSGNLNKKISQGSVWSKVDETKARKWFFTIPKEEPNKLIKLTRVWKMEKSSKYSEAKVTKMQLEKYFKKIEK